MTDKEKLTNYETMKHIRQVQLLLGKVQVALQRHSYLRRRIVIYEEVENSLAQEREARFQLVAHPQQNVWAKVMPQFRLWQMKEPLQE